MYVTRLVLVSQPPAGHPPRISVAAYAQSSNHDNPMQVKKVHRVNLNGGEVAIVEIASYSNTGDTIDRTSTTITHDQLLRSAREIMGQAGNGVAKARIAHSIYGDLVKATVIDFAFQTIQAVGGIELGPDAVIGFAAEIMDLASDDNQVTATRNGIVITALCGSAGLSDEDVEMLAVDDDGDVIMV